MKKLLMETAIPVNFTQAFNNNGWDWDPSDTNKRMSWKKYKENSKYDAEVKS